MSIALIFLGAYAAIMSALIGWLCANPRARFAASVQRDLAQLPVAEPDRVLS